jgi:hypothetical protein
MSQNRILRNVYVSGTVDGKRKWINIGTINRKGLFRPGKDISLIDWGVHE